VILRPLTECLCLPFALAELTPACLCLQGRHTSTGTYTSYKIMYVQILS